MIFEERFEKFDWNQMFYYFYEILIDFVSIFNINIYVFLDIKIYYLKR